MEALSMFSIRMLMALFCTYIPTTYSMQDNCHFYHASNVFYEPRFDRDWLRTFEVSFGGGSTESGRNACGAKVPLLDTWGLNTTLCDHSLETISLAGTFKIAEANFLYIQNLIKGFSLQAHIPVRSLHITHISSKNLSAIIPPQHVPSPSCRLPLDCNNLGDNTATTGFGDLTLRIAYSLSYQKTKKLDFIDVTLQTGILIPTSPATDYYKPFTIPLGYNGHWGLPLSLDVACGAYEWLTLAAHGGLILFADTTKKTNANTPNQCSMVHAHQKPLWNLGVLVKADHVMRGLSCTIGYSYAQQSDTRVGTSHSLYYEPIIINNPTRSGFSLHTLHLALEFDCMREEYWIGPRIAVLYNNVLGGTNIFATSMVYGQIGIDIVWDF
jgi:hypothetical protein